MRVLFKTFGCKANQYDTERMRQELEALGASTATTAGGAELCVVNTCTVTNQADADARRFIRRILRKNPRLKVVVAGCSSALKPHVYRSMPGVVGVVEGHDPVEVARTTLDPAGPLAEAPAVPAGAAGVHGGATVAAPGTTAPPAAERPAPGPLLVHLQMGSGVGEPSQEPAGGELLSRRRGGTRGWLKIQDGCDRKCSFCATRLARGASRSRAPEEVIAEAKLLARIHPELVLTGIHIGHYGMDLDRDLRLSSLVSLLLDQVPEVRFRLGSVEATEVDDLLLELMEGSGGALAPHLHMPLQSGSDSVLRRMRRWHTRETYRRRALEIAERLGVLGMGADIIAGFPGEEESDHALTLALVEELPFTYLHVFPFSPRDDTVAAGLDHPVPQRIAGERSRELREAGLSKGLTHRRRRVGEPCAVVLEGDGAWGLTEDYLRVAVVGERAGPSRVVRGVLEGSGEHLSIDLSRSHGPN